MAVPSTFRLVLRREEPTPAPRVAEGVRAAPEKGKLSREGFDKFLFTLDSDRDSAGRKYEVLRSKLISYFDWRNCSCPEDHADEALNRVIRKIEAGEELRDVSTYVFGVARMMLLEIARRMDNERTALRQLPSATFTDTESDETQQRIDCLRQCLAALPQKNRELITEYYEGEGSAKINRRKKLAANLGMQLNALRIRACRLREKLEECMGRCLASKGA
jgi:DNA-directed RNA polymerase specialized sigma24 family protein